MVVNLTSRTNHCLYLLNALIIKNLVIIEGCYKIPQICNSKERDEKVAKNSAFCQLKCMKRRYFAFNLNVSFSIIWGVM